MTVESSREPRGPRIVYLIGVAGNPNFGDEAIARQWLRFLAAAEPDAEVWFDTPHPGPAAALHRGAHPHLHFTDTIFRLCGVPDTEDPRAVAAFVRSALDDPGNAPWWAAGIDLFRSADLVHVIGGGYVNSIWPRHLGIVAACSWAADSVGATVGMTGAGLLPADGDALEVLHDAAERFRVLTVRDRPSLDLFEGRGDVRLSPDDIFLGGIGRLYDPGARSVPEFMVCVQTDLVEGDFGAVVEQVRRTLRSWGASPESPIGVVECIPRVDRPVYEALLEDFHAIRFYPLAGILRDGFPAAPHQRWISSRYHPHILASAAGARGTVLAVRLGYYDVKHDGVARMGSGWTRSTVGDVPSEPGEPGPIRLRAAGLSAVVAADAHELYG